MDAGVKVDIQVCSHAWPQPQRGFRQKCERCDTTRYIPHWLLTDEQLVRDTSRLASTFSLSDLRQAS